MKYSDKLTVYINRKGVLDVDTVKGCEFGMEKHPDGGCYGLCYACKVATLYGYDFTKSVSRKPEIGNSNNIEKVVKKHHSAWFRVGTMGDPSFDWDNTVEVCGWLGRLKTPVIITKHWINMSKEHAKELNRCGAVVNTSISPLDTKKEIEHRLSMFKNLKECGIKSVLRVVSAMFGDTESGNKYRQIQEMIFKNTPIIDNPLRIPTTDKRVLSGDIITCRHKDIGGGSTVSIARQSAYIGPCRTCPDQ